MFWRRDERAAPRRFSGWALPVVIVVALAVALLGFSAIQDAGPHELDRLQPSAPGTTWIYETQTNGQPSGRRSSRITGGHMLAGPAAGTEDPVAVTVMASQFDDFLGRGPYREDAYFGRDGERLVSFGVRVNGRNFTPSTPAFPLLQLPLRPGDSWRWDGSLGGPERRSVASVVGREDVMGMGRSWTGCPVVRSELTDPKTGAGIQSFVQWICPDLGIVRSRLVLPDGGTYDQELVEFHAPGRNLRDPSVARPGAAGSDQGTGTPAFDNARSSHIPGGQVDLERLAWSQSRTSELLFPPVGRPGLSVLAENDGTVSATDTGTGETRWQVEVARPVVASPVLASEVVLVASGDKSLYALDASTGLARWALRFPDIVSTAPVVHNETVVVAVDDHRLRALRLEDGAAIWEASTRDLVRSPPAIADDLVVVADRSGTVTALSVATGDRAWEASTSFRLNAGPVVAGDVVVAVDIERNVYGFDVNDGETRWSLDARGSVLTSPATDGRTVVFVTTTPDRLLGVDARSGRVRWRTETGATPTAPPAIVGGTVIVPSDTGRLRLFSMTDGSPLGEKVIRGPNAGIGFETTLPLAYVDDAIVVVATTADPGGDWPHVTLLAFPAGAPSPGRPGGAHVTGLTQPMPADPVAAPVMAGDALVIAGSDHTVWRISRERGAERVLTGLDTSFAVVQDDLVLVQRGDELVAAPLGGGDPRWTFPTGPSLSAPLPAPVVSRGVAVVPLPGQGLAGVDLQSGQRRWFLSVPGGKGASGPLALPGGDVVYGVGRLMRVDSETGTLRWSVEGVDSRVPLAHSQGVVLVADTGASGPSRLLAVDAQDGRELWSVPFTGQPLVGPVADEGVVVVVDSAGRVRSFDLSSGAPRWSAALRSWAAATPVVVDGRLIVAQSGTPELLASHGYELRVHDLQTGRYAASVELTGVARPGVVTAAGDVILAPTLAGLGLLRLAGP